MLKDELLAVLKNEPGGCAGLSVAWTKLNWRLSRAVSQAEIEASITELVQSGALREVGGPNETRLCLRGASREISKQPEEPPPATVGPPADPASISEEALMRPVESWIRDVHAPAYSLKGDGHPTFVVGDTSRVGTATGLYSRPDITVASVRRYRYSNLRRIELTGYELKKAGGGSIAAIHQALAHKRWVHSAYLIVFAPKGPLAPEVSVDGLKAECARHGVGLITFAHPNDRSTFEVNLQARADDVDPARVDEFISNQMQASEADIRRLLEA